MEEANAAVAAPVGVRFSGTSSVAPPKETPKRRRDAFLTPEPKLRALVAAVTAARAACVLLVMLEERSRTARNASSNVTTNNRFMDTRMTIKSPKRRTGVMEDVMLAAKAAIVVAEVAVTDITECSMHQAIRSTTVGGWFGCFGLACSAECCTIVSKSCTLSVPARCCTNMPLHRHVQAIESKANESSYGQNTVQNPFIVLLPDLTGKLLAAQSSTVQKRATQLCVDSLHRCEVQHNIQASG